VVVLVESGDLHRLQVGEVQKTCIEACDRKAIDLKQSASVEEIRVGSMVQPRVQAVLPWRARRTNG